MLDTHKNKKGARKWYCSKKIQSMNNDFKIFIVDDELANLNYYQQGLLDAGYTNIQLFLSGISCLNNLYQKPLVVFFKRELDNTTGSEVLEKIKQYSPAIKIVTLANSKNEAVVMDILNYRIYDYIIKDGNEVKKMEAVLRRIGSIKEPMGYKPQLICF